MPKDRNFRIHKNAKPPARDSESLYKKLFDSARQPMFIATLRGDVLLINMPCAAILGYENTMDLITHNVRELSLHLEQMEAILNELLVEGYVDDYELDFMKKNGKPIHVMLSLVLCRDDYGSIEHIYGFFRDNTEVKREQEEFRKRNNMLATMNKLAIELASFPSNENLQEFIAKRLKEITGAFAVGLSDYYPKEKILIANNIEMDSGLLNKINRILGRRMREVRYPVSDEMYREIVSQIVGKRKTLTEVSFGAVPPLASAAIQRLIKVDRFIGIAYVVENELYGTSLLAIKAGAQEPSFDLLESFANLVAVSLRQRRAEEALKHQLEVEERIAKELEEKTDELSRSNEELNSFVHTVSHDLKAPIISLNGFSELLVNNCGDKLDQTAKSYIDRIQKNSERMAALIDDLLELSRVGRIRGNDQEVNIQDIISDVTYDLNPLLENRGTKLIVKNRMPTVYCDCTRVTQIFSNLISNANKFIGDDNDNPTIEVGYNEQDECHKFHVRDNGIGIEKEYHEKIFQIFQRLHDVKADGTGIGLAIVKKIVEDFGGNIWVDSDKMKGATFYFTIPKSKAKMDST